MGRTWAVTYTTKVKPKPDAMAKTMYTEVRWSTRAGGIENLPVDEHNAHYLVSWPAYLSKTLRWMGAHQDGIEVLLFADATRPIEQSAPMPIIPCQITLPTGGK